jgi:hypothetical protein
MAVRHAAFVLQQATLSAADILSALGELDKEEGHRPALANEAHGTYAAIKGRNSKKSRFDSPRATTRASHSAAAAPGAPASENSYGSTKEWLEYSKNRGVLVEELYKRPNWRQFISAAGEKNDLRKKLLRLSPKDLAEILVKLDRG